MSTTAEIVLRFEESFDPLLFVEHALRAGWFFSEDGSMYILPPGNFEAGEWVLLDSMSVDDKFSLIREFAKTTKDFSISLVKGEEFDSGSWSFQCGYRELILSPDGGSHILRQKVKTLDYQKYINMIVDLLFDFYIRPMEISLHLSLSWSGRSGCHKSD